MLFSLQLEAVGPVRGRTPKGIRNAQNYSEGGRGNSLIYSFCFVNQYKMVLKTWGFSKQHAVI